MKLLIITQKVDQHDDVLGFMHGWITEFARQYEKVTVICLYKGTHSLPQNVEVLSLGKENGGSKTKYLINFYRLIFQKRKEYDAVFVHMNQVYVILGALLWRLWHKRIALWYAHGHVSISLRVAHLLTNMVFTSTSTGFRIASPKVNVVGQGIDTELFKPASTELSLVSDITIMSVGRIAPIKDYETLLEALTVLQQKDQHYKTMLIGNYDPKNVHYFEKLKRKIEEDHLVVSFVGSKTQQEVSNYLKSAQIFVNMSLTGSLDKAILEAMAAGVPVISCNEAFVEAFPELQQFIFNKKDAEDLAKKIRVVTHMNNDEQMELRRKLRHLIEEKHSIGKLIYRISSKLYE